MAELMMKRSRNVVEGQGMFALMPLRDLCELIALPYPTAIGWILKGAFEPSIRGSRSKNNPHRCNYKQALALSMCAAFQAVFELCPVKVVTMFINISDGMTDADLEAWLATIDKEGEEKDAHLEEVRAATRVKNIGILPFMVPEERQVWQQTYIRWMRVLAAFKLFGHGNDEDTERLPVATS